MLIIKFARNVVCFNNLSDFVYFLSFLYVFLVFIFHNFFIANPESLHPPKVQSGEVYGKPSKGRLIIHSKIPQV